MLRGKHIRRKGLWQGLYVFLILLAVLILLYPLMEPYFITTDQKNIVLSSLPEDIRQLRVVYVTDIHQDGFPWFSASRTAALISRINSFNADLVLFGGDYTSDPKRTLEFFEDLPDVHSNYGAFAVFGDHDLEVTEANYSDLRNVLNAKGITLLNNAAQPVRIGQKNIYIAGVNFSSLSRAKLSQVSTSLRNEDFVILLCHTPEAIEDLFRARDYNGRDNWFDIALFGHTHGDQLALGLPWLHIAPEVSEAHRRGWIEEQRTPMLISQGIGTTVFPIRIGCPPQIHLITIRSR